MKYSYLWLLMGSVFLSSCKTASYAPSKETAKLLPITENYQENTQVSDFIAPFKAHLQGEMSRVLAYNPTDLKKEREGYNTPLSNFMAQAGYEQADSVFFARSGKHIDFALFNIGGVRSELPKGNITVESAYKLMPFENKLLVVELSGKELYEMAHYLIGAGLSHPLSNQIELHFKEGGEIVSFKVKGKPVQIEEKYLVCTTDYLHRGGDKMYFFGKGIATDLDYNYRNALIDYFTRIDTLETTTDKRFYKLP